ncbi:M24 family metallopeptidase [Actinomadura rifamycini]|uniref:M24 family metallopeptidase n=1 Tax=Actinomadura rifamycini TaxID=31962 RepID=UPI001FDF4EBD|nr:M24 family metallopeptidase [Actinomadura rifamycini]
MSNNVALARVDDPAELERFRAVQRLSYACAEAVAGTLEPGTTEREACRRMRRWLRERGVDDWLHTPFAWFGDRSAFTGFRVPTQFLPSGARLEEGMPYVLDMAPVKDGYCADIGYGGVLGENRVWERVDADLAEYRTLILRLVRERRTFADVYAEVDALIERQGHRNRHRAYPGRVIGHQVGMIGGFLPKRVGFPFGVRFLQTMGRELVTERVRGRSPLWNGGAASRHAPTPGLWAVEPHIAFRGVGVKFEEILVVTGDDAYWLDDDLPHVRRWARREAA